MSKFLQMWYLLHFCCNLVTLVNPFFRPVLLTLPFACSTYIPTLAIFDVFLTSEGNICIAAVQLGGIHNVAIDIIRSSFILNPLSAITSS